MLKMIKDNVGKVVIGKEALVDFFMIALLTKGHILIEDMPGLGKTLISKVIAKSIDSSFKRIQFTPDILPSDVLGFLYYDERLKDFKFKQGPIFGNIVLIDEINRATPKTQSALLEVMEEKQVSVDGEIYFMENVFMVIATQNPIEQFGTYELPEAQLDRFLFKISMGYPTLEHEKNIVTLGNDEGLLRNLSAVINKDSIEDMQNLVSKIKCSDEVIEYLLNIVRATRNNSSIEVGVSPRGSGQLYRACQARALLLGRDYITPGDIVALSKPVLAHRMKLRDSILESSLSSERIIEQIIENTQSPFDGDS